jgi:subtilase family serine protease
MDSNQTLVVGGVSASERLPQFCCSYLTRARGEYAASAPYHAHNGREELNLNKTNIGGLMNGFRDRDVVRRSIGLLCGALLLLFGKPSPAAEMKTLAGHIPPAVKKFDLQPVGRLSVTNQLHLAVGLPLHNQATLNSLLQQIYDPASPQYHHYLTTKQFTETFGPTEQDYQAVIGFAKSNGLAVAASFSNRVVVDMEGTVADVEKALHVTIRTYNHPTEARTFYAPDVEPSIDSSIPVLEFAGLNNYGLAHANSHGVRLPKNARATPDGGTGPYGTFWGYDLRNAYVPGTGLTGAGQSVGLVELDGYYTNDIVQYERMTGLPNVPLQNVLIDGFSGNPPYSDEFEVALDIEMAISMAPGLSQVIVYETANGPVSVFVDILSRMASDNKAKQIGCSWGYPYGTTSATADQLFQEFVAQGQSFFQASGDNGAITSGIGWPDDHTNVTSVGGTVLTTTAPGGAWASETTWSGSGGGISTIYVIPNWQQGVNMSANQGSMIMRNIPDVSMVATNIGVIADDGGSYEGWGTSFSTPLWAGFTALVNQQAAANGQAPVGFLNPALYTIGTGTIYSLCFHDITTGNNTNSGSHGKFVAVPGYDLCTGWGTPIGGDLINGLLSITNPPPTPQRLSATTISTNWINLTWSAATTATGYIVNRGGSQIATTTATSYSDVGLAMGTTYCYTIAATNSGGGASADSSPACATTYSATTNPNLLAHWTFDEGSGSTAYDYSGNGNTGTVIFSYNWGGDGSWTPNGIVNGALYFDGEFTQVTVSNSPSLNPVNGITLAAWVNDGSGGWYNTSRILEKGKSSNQYALFVNSSGASIEFSVAGVSNGTITVSPPSTGFWHHLAATYDGSSLLSFYIDGLLVTQQVASGTLPITTDPLVIGNKPGNSSAVDFFYGDIDDVRIYGSALTPSQIAQLYNIDSVGDGIPDWWRLQWFGSSSSTNSAFCTACCSACDADGTGQDNFFKYVAGLNPTDPTQVFVVQIAASNQFVNLTYGPINPNLAYTVLSSPDLFNYSGLASSTDPQTNGNQVAITDLAPWPSNEFYRIQISLP